MSRPDGSSDAVRILDSGLFNHMHYEEQAQLRNYDPLRAVEHYLQHGEGAGLSPNPLFSPGWYSRRWNVQHALLDYLALGSERDPHALFDTAFYLGQGIPLAPGETPLAHYIRTGWREAFDPHPLFSITYYIEENADVASHGYEPLEHFIVHGWREHRRPCPEFDPIYYINRYPDIAQTGLNPLLHYATDGGRELRDPSAEFDAAWYTAQLRVINHGANPLAHYRTIGKAAGWLPKRARWSLNDLGMLAAADAKAWAQNAFLQAASTAGSPRPVTTIILGEPIPDLPEEGLVFFLQAGDVPHPEALATVAGTSDLLTTFDAMARDLDGSVLPILLPGANPLILQNCSSLPPFCVDAAFCRKRPPPSDQDPTALRAWFGNLVQQAAATGTLRHLPVPVANVPLLRHRPIDALQLPDVTRITRAVVAQGRARALVEDVSVVISTKDAAHLLVQLVLSMLQPPLPQVREVVLVVNRPVNAFARSYHAQLRDIDRLRIIDYDKPYNFSDQANIGANVTSGEFVLILNDDIVPIGRQWLMHMLLPFERPEVSISGPLLLYPDETVQHAGMFLGFNNVAGHLLRGARLPDARTSACLTQQNCSAVTGAAMLVRRTVWDALAGFDTQLATYLQDVDFCLRAHRMGWEIAFTPDAILLHMESVSAKSTLSDPTMMDRRSREYDRFNKRWGDAVYNDPFHSPHWSKQDETLRTIVALGPADIRNALLG